MPHFVNYLTLLGMQIVCQRNINGTGEDPLKIVRLRNDRPETDRTGVSRYFSGFRYLAYQAR
jgi:hypothetical protein